MLSRLWLAVGAVVCGIAVARALGGTTTAWELFGLAGAALIIAAASLASRRTAGRRRWKSEGESQKSARSGHEHRDRELVDQLFGLIDERDIRWLRHERFDGPWSTRHESTLREISHFGGARAIYDDALSGGAREFVDATVAFLSVYDRHTLIDPTTLDPAWRVVAQSESGAEGGATAGIDPCALLMGAAAAICECYDALCLVTGRTPSLARA